MVHLHAHAHRGTPLGEVTLQRGARGLLQKGDDTRRSQHCDGT